MTALTATERELLTPGYRRVYTPPAGETVTQPTQARLRRMRRGQRVTPRTVQVRQTTPPTGMSETALLRQLQTHGIGRPATYAGIAATLLRRKYVTRQTDAGVRARLVLTRRGRAVCAFLTETYPDVFSLTFTGHMETALDALAAGRAGYAASIQPIWALLTPNE